MNSIALHPSVRSFDVAVIGGGPAGATAARDLARAGHSVFLLDRPGRIKPCGGAIPPRLVRDFDIPDDLLVARAHSARMVAPSGKVVNMPIEGGFVGMVDREHFDEWLRERAAMDGATLCQGSFDRIEHRGDETLIHYRPAGSDRRGETAVIRATAVIGADGANSAVARQCIEGFDKGVFVAAYHEIVETPEDEDFDGTCCEIHYRGDMSPDFYSWIFPHGKTTSVGTGTAVKGFSIRGTVEALREQSGITGRTVRREGAPIPLKPLPRWDDGRNVLLAGDAAGVVAPSSGEGIYYAMVGGAEAARSMGEFLATADVRALKSARKRFMKAHGRVFFILGIMQKFWYVSDKRRERFVTICDDPDVQELTWQAYMNKELVRAKPMAHVRIFFKDLAHLFGLARA